MSKRSPKSVEEKLEIVNLYLEKGRSISSLIREYRVSDTTIRTWVRKYKQLGIAGLKERKTWTRYSKEIKEQAYKIIYLDEEVWRQSLKLIKYPLEVFSKRD